jgi:hypothetical protein
VELKNKHGIEEAIMMGMKEKYTASFHTPFMTLPLNLDFGYLSQGIQAERASEGSYTIPDNVDKYTASFIKHLKQPDQITKHGEHPQTIPVEVYKSFWKKAKKHYFLGNSVLQP